MKFKIQQNSLKEAINIVQKAVSTRSTLPILKGILLIAKANELTLIGNDLQIGIETKCYAEVIETGSVVIDSKI